MTDMVARWREEGQEHRWIGELLFRLYGHVGSRLRTLIRLLILRLEGGFRFSVTLRRIQLHHYGVAVGMYTGDGAFEPDALPPGTQVGRYCSMAAGFRAFNANHPMSFRSMHAFFYNPYLGFVQKDMLTRTRLTIGNDVWIGHNAIITSSVKSVGDGAVIGAGALVHQDVPPYAVVVGNPARVVRYRFTETTIEQLIREQWWQRPLKELLRNITDFQTPLDSASGLPQ